MALKGILFDFDGTLANTEEAHFRVWNHVLGKFGQQLSEADFAANFTGLSVEPASKRLIERFDLPVTTQELVDLKVNMTIEVFAEEPPQLMPQVIEVLEWAHQKGLKLAIVTASSRAELMPVFEYYHFEKYFQKTVTRDDVVHSKPEPECYLLGLERLGLEASDAAAVEDTGYGVQAASRAGLEVIAVPHAHSEGQDYSLATHIASSLKEGIQWLSERRLEEPAQG